MTITEGAKDSIGLRSWVLFIGLYALLRFLLYCVSECKKRFVLKLRGMMKESETLERGCHSLLSSYPLTPELRNALVIEAMEVKIRANARRPSSSHSYLLRAVLTESYPSARAPVA